MTVLVVVWCLIGLASPLVFGRWPAGLLTHRWRWPALVWAVLVFQALTFTLDLPDGLGPVLHVLTYVGAAAFLWMNRMIAGVWFVGAGALVNGVVIALNGGTLPARREAAEAAGVDHGLDFANTAVLDDPVLPWLGDYWAWPEPLPFANTFSVGDILIVIGAFVAAWMGAERFGRTTVRESREQDFQPPSRQAERPS